MRFNKYQAMGIIGTAIRTGEVKSSMNEAAMSYFTEHRTQNTCTVKRVAVRHDGSVHNDPEFKAKRVSKNRA